MGLVVHWENSHFGIVAIEALHRAEIVAPTGQYYFLKLMGYIGNKTIADKMVPKT